MPRRTEPQPWRELGRRIALAREAAHLSQRDLAPLIGISEGYVPQIERGARRPDPEILRAVARQLGLDYNELAVLASYLPRPVGDQTVEFPPDVAPYARELRDRGYAAEVWRALLVTAGAWVVGARRSADAERGAEHESDEHGAEQP